MAAVTRADATKRPESLWRWRELLPVRDDAFVCSLGETTTPIIALPGIARAHGFADLRVKDDGRLPTGSFKARGAAVGVSRAKELGVRAFAMPTNGNAGAAWASYARGAGISAFVAIPKTAPAIHAADCIAAGAEVEFIDGLISDAGKRVAHVVAERRIFDASTLKEPYRIEGKKTLGFEIAQQFSWRPPDVIIYPTGGGVGLIGIDKAMRELAEIGWLEAGLPRMVAVQASGCAPIVRAWDSGATVSESWTDAHTIAFGINVPKAIGDFMVIDTIRKTGGCAVAVDDAEIVEAKARMSADGAAVCLEGAATLAAALRLRGSGWIGADDRVLLVNTGAARD
jgi:threonine synthase